MAYTETFRRCRVVVQERPRPERSYNKRGLYWFRLKQ